MFIQLPKFNRQSLVQYLDQHVEQFDNLDSEPHTLGAYNPPIGNQLMHDVLPTVQAKVPDKLYVHNTFGRICTSNAHIKVHVDRAGVHWAVSVNIQRDAPWDLEIFVNNRWGTIAVEDPRLGILLNGETIKHRRGTYTGIKAYQLVLFYTRDYWRENDAVPPYVLIPKVLSSTRLKRFYSQFNANDPTQFELPEWAWLKSILLEVVQHPNKEGLRLNIAGPITGTPQFIRHATDQSCPWGADCDPSSGDQAGARSLSMITLLQKPVRGGEIELRRGGTIDMEPGDAIIFPANEEYRILKVIEGTRGSLVFWMFKS